MKLDEDTKALLEMLFYIGGCLFIVLGTMWLWGAMLSSL